MQGTVSRRKMLGHQVLSPIKVSSSVAVFTASEPLNTLRGAGENKNRAETTLFCWGPKPVNCARLRKVKNARTYDKFAAFCEKC